MNQQLINRVHRAIAGQPAPSPMGIYDESGFEAFFHPQASLLETKTKFMPAVLGPHQPLPSNYVVILPRLQTNFLLIPFSTEKTLTCCAKLNWWPSENGNRRPINSHASIWMRPEHIDRLLNGTWCNESIMQAAWAVCNEATKRVLVEEEIQEVHVLGE